jgi:hypothetical protein
MIACRMITTATEIILASVLHPARNLLMRRPVVMAAQSPDFEVSETCATDKSMLGLVQHEASARGNTPRYQRKTIPLQCKQSLIARPSSNASMHQMKLRNPS